MKTTKLLICLMTIIMALPSASAQQTMTTTDSLMKYKWVSSRDYSGSSTLEHYAVFDEKIRTTVTVYDVNHKNYYAAGGPIYKLELPYYVSDTKDTSFRDSEVGKRKNGRFIIVKRKGNDFSVYEIHYLKDQLILQFWQDDIYSTVSIWEARPKDGSVTDPEPPADPTPPKKPVDPRAPVVDPLWPVNPGDPKPVF